MSHRQDNSDSGFPLRVCYVIDNLSTELGIVGGTEHQLLYLIRSLDRSKVKPYVCLLDGANEGALLLDLVDCPVVRLRVTSLKRISTLKQAVRFARFLRRERIDLLQVYFPDSTYFAIPVARLVGVRHIIRTSRNLGYWMTPRDRWFGRLYNLLTSVTVANCDACRASVIANEQTRPDSIVVIPNAIQWDRFEGIANLTWPKSPDEPIFIGAVANLRPIKRLDLLIRAAGYLVTRYPNLRFRIAGDGPLRSDLERLAYTLGVEQHVEFIGPCGDIPGFLNSLHLSVLCSDSEGLSNALMEYMAAGRAIVATAVGGNTELIEHEKHGLLIPPDNTTQLAKTIERLVHDAKLAVCLGASARNRVRTEYGEPRHAHHYESLYANLISPGDSDDFGEKRVDLKQRQKVSVASG